MASWTLVYLDSRLIKVIVQNHLIYVDKDHRREVIMRILNGVHCRINKDIEVGTGANYAIIMMHIHH